MRTPTLSLILLAFCFPGEPVAAASPNVIVVLADDAGFADFGCYGGKEIPTPHIDRLAAAGVRCTQAYVTASVCCPSRAGLLTGRYQQRFGHECNGPTRPEPGYSQSDMGLDPSEATIGDVLQARGYRTMAVGKWHMGNQPQFEPQNRGFHEFYGFWGGSRSFWPIAKPSKNAAMRRGRTAIDEKKEISYLTDDLTDAAIEFIGRHRARPFFVYLSYNAVHTPMHAKPADLAAFAHIENQRRRTYAAMTKSLDDNVGRLTSKLREWDLEKDTLVLFVNDNGGATNNGSDNGPLRGMKGSKWEGGVRVPLIAKWPAGLPAGKVYAQPVSLLDILPTSLAAAGGAPKSAAKPLDGVDLLPFLRGETEKPPHEALFWRRSAAAAVRQGRWKLLRVRDNPVVLIDLASDPAETRNVATQHPDRVKSLLAELAAWEKGLSPRKWKEGDRWEQNQIHKHRMDVIGREAERRFP